MKKNPTEQDKLAEAAAVLQADRAAREQAFIAELQALCQKYRVDLVPTFQAKAQ